MDGRARLSIRHGAEALSPIAGISGFERIGGARIGCPAGLRPTSRSMLTAGLSCSSSRSCAATSRLDERPDRRRADRCGRLLTAFVAVEAAREASRCSRCGFFRNPSFTGVQIAAVSISASFFAIFLYVTLYLQQILGLSAIEAGLVYLPGTLVMLFVSGATAQLGARVPARTMIGVGLAMVAAGMGLFTLAGVSPRGGSCCRAS